MRARPGAVSVMVKDSLERAIRVLKRKVQKEGKLSAFRKRRHFVPPAKKRKLEKAETQRKIRRAQFELARRLG